MSASPTNSLLQESEHDDLCNRVFKESLTAALNCRYWSQLSQRLGTWTSIYQGFLAICAVFASGSLVAGWAELYAEIAGFAAAILAAIQPFLPWPSRAKLTATLAGHWAEIYNELERLEVRSCRLTVDELEAELVRIIEREKAVAKQATGLPRKRKEIKRLTEEIRREHGV